MPLTLSCRDLGSECDVTVSGNSVDELIEQMSVHAIEIHSKPRDVIYSDETRNLFRSALKQSSRPANVRTTPKTDV